MSDISNRRQFLKFGAAAAVGAALPENLKRALAVAPSRVTGTIRDVEHVVILMQENRSFDHYFGCLQGVRGYGDPRAETLPDGNSVFAQPDGKGGHGENAQESRSAKQALRGLRAALRVAQKMGA
nr:alkaline phosphatase family protein [Komagataeibacter xylinus]